MTLIIRGQLVERIVVHGSEQTIWELPVGGGDAGALLRIAEALELLGITEEIHVDFDRIHNMEQERLNIAESADVGFDQIHNIEPYGSIAGMTDTVQIFINEEEV
jgi:hypothetical protein